MSIGLFGLNTLICFRTFRSNQPNRIKYSRIFLIMFLLMLARWSCGIYCIGKFLNAFQWSNPGDSLVTYLHLPVWSLLMCLMVWLLSQRSQPQDWVSNTTFCFDGLWWSGWLFRGTTLKPWRMRSDFGLHLDSRPSLLPTLLRKLTSFAGLTLAGILHRQSTDQLGETWVWACLLGCERWWTMPGKGEDRGNSDGGQRHWRANRSSYVGIGAKDNRTI